MGAVQEVLHEPFKQDTCKPNGAQINNWNKVLWLLDKPFCAACCTWLGCAARRKFKEKEAAQYGHGATTLVSSIAPAAHP
jgi:hypothetical protein